MKKKILILFLSIIAMVATVFGVAACNSSDSDGITLSSTGVTVEVGYTVTVSATVADDLSVTWTSADSNIVSVTTLANAAILKGVAVGETTVTATAGEYSATCNVTVTPAVTYTISLNNSAVTSADVVKGKTITLSVSASDGSDVSYWGSADTSVATVDKGVVTGITYGSTTIYAGKDSSHCSSIKLNVVAAEGTVGYNLSMSDDEEETTALTDPGTWYYWTEWSKETITTKEYEDGTITLTFTGNQGGWYNIQLFYKDSSLTSGTAYLLSFKVNTTKGGYITVNGIVYTLSAGDNTIYAPYYESDTGYSASIQIGAQDNGVINIDAATMIFSDFSWTETQAEMLATPSFSVDNDVITITDTNTSWKVSSYKLYLYDENNNLSGAVNVTNGMKVSELDTSTIAKGTYTAYLKAIGLGSIYANSANSTSSTTITVTEDPNYALNPNTESNIVSIPGTWCYNTQWWVSAEGSYASDTVTLTFSNNSGFWYDTQLFYKNPTLTAGYTYKLTFTLNSTAAGTITVNGKVVTIAEGNNSIEVEYTEASSGSSISIQLGYNDESDTGVTDIESGTIKLSNFDWELVSTGGGSGETYDAADFTVLAGTLDTASEYTIEHKEATDAASNAGTIYVWYIGDYEYWNAWAAVSNTDVTASYSNGTITWSTTKNATYGSGYWYANQLFYKNSALTSGTTYMLTLTINSSVATSITINGTVVALDAGENTVTVFYTESGTSLSIQMGVDGSGSAVDALSLTMSNISWYAKESSNVEYEVSGEAIYPSYTNTLTKANEFDYSETWIYWYVESTEWNCGSIVTMSAATLENDTITLTYTGGSVSYSVQLFYTNSSLTSGNHYRLTCTVNASVACTVIINGKTFELDVGDNTIEVDFLLLGDSNISAFDMQMAGTSTETTIKVSNVAWYNLVVKEGGDQGEEPDTSNAETVTLTYVEKYGNDEYFQFTATSDYNISNGNYDYVTVNGTQRWAEGTDNQNGTYTFKVYVGDTTLTTYVIYWYKDGNVVAMATYPETSGGNPEEDPEEDPGTDPGTDDPVTITLAYVEAYGNYYFYFTATSTCDISTDSYSHVTVNGTQQWSEGSLNGDGTYAFKVYVGDLTLKEYVFNWYKDGDVVATATYTPAESSDPEEDPGTDPGTDDPVTVTLVLVESYDNYYFYLTATSSYDLTTTNYVTVNGSQAWSETTLNGDGTYAFKVNVGDLTLTSYVFNWYLNGDVVATATYTPEEDPGEDPGTDPGTDDPVTVTLTYVQTYGDYYFQFTATSDYDISDGNYSYVTVNGTQRWAEGTDNQNGTYTFKVYVDDTTLTEYVFKWYKESSVVATATYTPEEDPEEDPIGKTYSAIYTNTLSAGSSTGESNVELDSWAIWYADYASVTMSSYSYTEDIDGITFTYTGATEWYYVQVLYKSSELTTGETYTLTCTITIDADCNVTINGVVKSLTAGENEVSVVFTLTDTGVGSNSGTSSFDMQMGVNGISTVGAATVTISNVTWTKGSSEDETKNYTALASSLNTESTYDITHGEQTVATANAGTIYVYYIGDYNYTYDWSSVENSDVTANYNNGTITWSTTKNATYGSNNWWANQLFYDNSELTTGTTYMLSLTINSSVATSITINGTVVALDAGENNVKVIYTESTGASISMQMGVDGTGSDVDELSLTISDISWYTEAAE